MWGDTFTSPQLFKVPYSYASPVYLYAIAALDGPAKGSNKVDLKPEMDCMYPMHEVSVHYILMP